MRGAAMTGTETSKDPSALGDGEFDPELCAETLDWIAGMLEQAGLHGWRVAPELLAEVLKSCAELVRFAHTWVVEQSKTVRSAE